MQAVVIRAVAEQDFDGWLPLWEAYQRFYKVEIPADVTRKTWARFLDSTEPMHAALAVIGDKPLGLVHWLYHRSTWTIGDHCYLQDLFVASEARGARTGRALIEHVFADAKDRDAPRVYWSTHETNQTAMQLYDRMAERSGFVLYRKLLA